MKTRPGGQPEARPSAPASGVRAVFLVGFMGAGKSTVGRALCERLGWEFEDLDERIQVRESQTIEQIFRLAGEAAFRIAEREAIRELLATLESSPRVVALGGGAFVQPENAALLKAGRFPIVFLDAPVDELFRRCQQEPVARPLRRDLEQFRRLYEARRPHYLGATLRIETAGKDVHAVAAEIESSLGLR